MLSQIYAFCCRNRRWRAFYKVGQKIASKIFKNGTLTKCPLDVDNCLKWITGERNASLLRDWQCAPVTHAAIESKPRLMWPLVTIVQPDLMEKFTLMAEEFLPQYYRLTKCLPSGTAVSQAGCVRSIQKTKRNKANDQVPKSTFSSDLSCTHLFLDFFFLSSIGAYQHIIRAVDCLLET